MEYSLATYFMLFIIYAVAGWICAVSYTHLLKTVIKMLYLVTRKALVSTFKGEELNKVRDEYIKMIEYLKHGILK